MSRLSVLSEVSGERDAQESKWGEQNHPNGTRPDFDGIGRAFYQQGSAQGFDLNRELYAKWATFRCDQKHSTGDGTWEDILTEEYAEAIACEDEAQLRAELIQVAAVAVAWVEALDRKSVPS